MFFSSLFGRLTRGSKPNPEGRPHRRTSPSRKGSFRPTLEALEDRNMLSAGMLNSHFGTGGKTLINFAANTSLFTVGGPTPTFAVTPDGMTVLAGMFVNRYPGPSGIAVAELTKDGNLNSHFGSGGEIIINLQQIGATPNIVVQPDGTIVLVAPERFDVAVVELNKDGRLNSSFGNSGVTLVPLSTPTNFNFYDTLPNNFVVKPDGEIVLYLEPYTYDPVTDTNTIGPIMVAELTKDGNLNPHFGNGGESFFAGDIFGPSTAFQPDFSSNNGMAPWNPLAVTGDGTIVLTGQVSAGQPPNIESPGIGVVELTKNGSLNDQFGQGGKVFVDFGPNLAAVQFSNSVVKQDGTILLAATPYNPSDFNISYFGVAELNKDGSLNSKFGVGGETLVDFGANYVPYLLTNIAVQPNGTIVLGGTVTPPNDFTVFDFGVAELTKDGHLKADFGVGGKTIFDFGANYSIIGQGNFVVQPDGTIVLATMVTNITTGQVEWAVAELTKDGNLDPNFGAGGETIFGAGNSAQLSYAIVAPDGTIVLAGNLGVPGSFNQVAAWAVAELTGNHSGHEDRN